MNQVLLSGRIASDIKLMENAEGRKYTFVNLAVDSDKSKDTTYFLSIIANEKQAEVLSQYAKKGSMIEVVAYLKTKSVGEGSDRKTSTYIIMSDFHFVKVGRKQESEVTEEEENTSAPVQQEPVAPPKPPAKTAPATKTDTKKTQSAVKQPTQPVQLGDIDDNELPF